jgi:hypothetical protein
MPSPWRGGARSLDRQDATLYDEAVGIEPHGLALKPGFGLP